MTGEYKHGVADEASLHPCTKKITPVEFRCRGHETIILIDTPGFDYSNADDEYTRFDQLCKWFRNKLVNIPFYTITANSVSPGRYGPRTKLDGVIYMHNIWNTEAYHRSPFLTCQALEALCGQDWRRKVVFVNYPWSEGITNDGEEREKCLRAGYWRFMLSKGSIMMRYESPGDQKRARQILKDLIAGR